MKLEARDTDNNFTILRLILALAVVLGHFQAFYGVRHTEWPFGYASAAVDCFFVVSGYLVSNSFDRDSDFARFYIRRFFRIYPLYLIVITLQTIVLASLAPGGMMAHLPEVARYFFANAMFANFVQHDIGGVLTGMADPSLNASLWTLKIEFGFYLVLPFLWIGVRRFGAPLLVAVFVLSLLYQEGLGYIGQDKLAKQLPGQMQFFVLGVAAYRYHPIWSRYLKTGTAFAAILTIALGVLMTALLKPEPPLIYPLVVGAFVIMATFKAPIWPVKTDISYGVYLVHAPVIQLSLIFGLYRHDLYGLAGILAAVIAIALVVERLVEQPGIAMGKSLCHKLRPAKRGPTVTPPPVSPTPTPTPPGGGGEPMPAPGIHAPVGGARDMTVVVLNDFCHVQGGASKVAIDEAIGLAYAGANVIFIGAVGPVCAELKAAPLKVECLGQRELLDVRKHPSVALQGLWNGEAARRVREILSKLPRDHTVVHLHGYTKALSTSAVRAAGNMGYAVVCTLHDFFSVCPNGAFFDYRKNVPCPRKALSIGCIAANCDKRHYAHKLFRTVRAFVQRHLGGLPDTVQHYISLSAKSEELLTPYLPKKAHIHRLENSIDWRRPNPTAASRNKTVLYVGRLDQEKGVHLLAEAGQRLGLQITFVGDGPMRSVVEAYSCAKVVGWVPRTEVSKYIANARCLVFPSMWYETFGLVVAEAAAYGVPAIISDVSAAAERIQDGQGGWQFRSGDVEDLIRCLQILDDDARVRAAGETAYRRFWTSTKGSASHAADLVKIYRTALVDA